MDELQLKLCDIQGRLFELSAEKKYRSAAFIKAFMTSDTAKALDSIGRVGGPRCCKRDSWLAILAAVDFVQEHLQIKMKRTVPVCSHSARNNQCIGSRCPFSAARRREEPPAKTKLKAKPKARPLL